MSQKNFMSYGDAETLFTEVGQELSDKVPKSQLTANNTDFRFGYDENTGKYGYIINEGGADTVVPFKTTGTRSGAITSNGTYTASTDISEDGYESVVVNVPNSVQTKSVTAGTADVTVSPDSGYIGMSSVTVSPTPSQEKSVTSSRSAQTVTPDSGKLLSKVTVNALAPSGTYTASSRGNSLDMGATSNYRYVNTNGVPNSNTETYTFPANNTGGTKDLGATNNYRYVNAGNVYTKGKVDGRAERDSGVTVTAANHIVSGYKARNSSGTLLTGTATTGGKVTSEQTKTVQIRSASWSVTFSFPHGVLGIKSMSDCAGIRSISISGNTVSGGYSGNDEDYSMTVVGY